MRAFLFTIAVAVGILCQSVAKAAHDFEIAFNEPGLTGEATTTIENKFLELLQRARPGSEILINADGLLFPYISLALVRAQARGIRVGVLLRPYKDVGSKQALEILKKGQDNLPGLGTCDFGPCLKTCSFGCSGPGINHNKFILLSELSDGTRNVVVHTSNNFMQEERHNYNDFLVLKNSPALFSAFKRYWLTIYAGKQNPRLPLQITQDVKLHIFPKPIFSLGKRRDDPVRNLLESVRCTPTSKVHLAHSLFSDARIEIAKELARLKREGCDVKVLIKNDVGTDKVGPIRVTAHTPGRKIFKTLGNILYVFPFEEPINGRPYEEGDPKRNAVHAKYMLIDALIGGESRQRKLLVIGSHNLDSPSLKLNNEFLMEISDDRLFEVYALSFQRVLDSFLALPPRLRVACPVWGCIEQ